MTDETRRLMCRLTEDERRERGAALVAALTEVARVTAEARRAAAEYRDARRRAQERADELRTALHLGAEERDVQVSVVIASGAAGATLTAMRLDTGEVIEDRPATQAERQIDFAAAPDAAPRRRGRPAVVRAIAGDGGES